MLKSRMVVFVLVVSLLISANTTVFGESVFKDIDDNEFQTSITALYNEGIVQGTGNNNYEPDRSLKNSEALQLIVNFLDLSLAKFTFIKAPEATDYFINADNDAWYAEAWTIAVVNGIHVSNDLVPGENMSKEVFYHLIIQGMEDQYGMPMIKIATTDISDEASLNVEYQGSIQRGIVYGVVSLNNSDEFNPKAPVSRGEAAKAISTAIDYLKEHNFYAVEAPAFQAFLNTETTDDGVVITFDFYNQTGTDQVITYTSGKKYDYFVYDSEGALVEQWSANKRFMMSLEEVTFGANDYIRYEDTWNYSSLTGGSLSPGAYRIVFETNFLLNGENITIQAEDNIEIK